MHTLLRSGVLAAAIPYWGQSLLRVLGVIVAVLIPAGTIVYLYLFKAVSFMQSRLGPMEAGPYGSMQLFAEVGKFLQKEDLNPEARRPLHLPGRAGRRADQHLPHLPRHPVRARRGVRRLLDAASSSRSPCRRCR